MLKSLAKAAFSVSLLIGGFAGTQTFGTTPAVAAGETQTAEQSITYHTVKIDGVDLFYREAGPKDAPVVLLLHGFPSSSHMFRNLIPELSATAHVIAPDYPGYGYSGAPSPAQFSYTFDHLADLVGALTDRLEVERYVIYMQDFGGPVGFRLAMKRPDRVTGMIIQNATIHKNGWNPEVVKQMSAFWNGRNAETENAQRGFLKPETTMWQYVHGATLKDRLNPDAWKHDQLGLDRAGNDAIQLEYFWDYQNNVTEYPKWQSLLKARQYPTLIVWGKNDPFFTVGNVEALHALVPNAETHLYDAGHFALETHAREIGAEIRDFLKSKIAR